MKKWNLDRDIQLNTRLKEAQWQSDIGQYKLLLVHNGNEEVEYTDILISGQGILKYYPVLPPTGSRFLTLMQQLEMALNSRSRKIQRSEVPFSELGP